MFKVTSKSLHHAPARLIRQAFHDVRPSLEVADDAVTIHHRQYTYFTRLSSEGSVKQFQRVPNPELALVSSSGVCRRNYASMTVKMGTNDLLCNNYLSFSLQPHLRRRYSSNADLAPHQEIGMPSLSPTMTEGNIARWLKKEGDKVSPGEVEAIYKATVEMECMEEGFLAKIIRDDGTQGIKVGEVIDRDAQTHEPTLKSGRALYYVLFFP